MRHLTRAGYATAMELVAGTGLRLTEVCGLRWSDVELDRGVLIVRQQAVQIGSELTLVGRAGLEPATQGL